MTRASTCSNTRASTCGNARASMCTTTRASAMQHSASTCSNTRASTCITTRASTCHYTCARLLFKNMPPGDPIHPSIQSQCYIHLRWVFSISQLAVFVGNLCGMQRCSSEGSHYYNPCKAAELVQNFTKALNCVSKLPETL